MTRGRSTTAEIANGTSNTEGHRTNLSEGQLTDADRVVGAQAFTREPRRAESPGRADSRAGDRTFARCAGPEHPRRARALFRARPRTTGQTCFRRAQVCESLLQTRTRWSPDPAVAP